MPGKDTMGPEGQGPGTGRGQGNCKIGQGCRLNRQQGRNQVQNPPQNIGVGQCRRNNGMGRGFGKSSWNTQSVKTD